jgi:hypothetical protein
MAKNHFTAGAVVSENCNGLLLQIAALSLLKDHRTEIWWGHFDPR